VRLRPGTLIVLEGLDKTGKTTQRQALEAAGWDEPAPLVTHMPSGQTDLTRAIYETTEHADIHSSLARQLLHLACHAENLVALATARERVGLISIGGGGRPLPTAGSAVSEERYPRRPSSGPSTWCGMASTRIRSCSSQLHSARTLTTHPVSLRATSSLQPSTAMWSSKSRLGPQRGPRVFS
jgi:hypothetical protein